MKKRQVVKGIPQEIVDRLLEAGGTTNQIDYDSVCTAIDTEIYKLVVFEMLEEAGVFVCVNTLLTAIKGVITECRSKREAIYAKSFVDCTGYGDLSAYAGAHYTEPNDYSVANSIGVGNVSVEKYYEFLESHDAVSEYSKGLRSGKEGQIVRLNGRSKKLPPEFTNEARKIGMSMVTTTVHDDYFMFIKLNFKMPVSPTNSLLERPGSLLLVLDRQIQNTASR